VQAWNSAAMRRFGTDVDALLQFAGRHLAERTFARIDDLCSFLVREQWHLASNPEHLTASYPNMDPELVRTSALVHAHASLCILVVCVAMCCAFAELHAAALAVLQPLFAPC
jgi:hypothetical protein